MKQIIYFLQFVIVILIFLIFKILGYKKASNLGSFLGYKLGPILRSNKIILENLKKFNSNLNKKNIDNLVKGMWEGYGRILSDYVFIPSFKKRKLEKFINIQGQKNLDKIKKEKKPVVFISGHFDNFELMPMIIEREGIDTCAIYRPLNNRFLNFIMEYLRKNYICSKQFKKGINGVKQSLSNFKNGSSLAIMIDQRVSEGLDVKFFDHFAFTTTIPAQFVKKFKCKVQPVHIVRFDKYYFKILFDEPIEFNDSEDIESITIKLNNWLEKKISLYPEQWIWTHNRWKH